MLQLQKLSKLNALNESMATSKEEGEFTAAKVIKLNALSRGDQWDRRSGVR